MCNKKGQTQAIFKTTFKEEMPINRASKTAKTMSIINHPKQKK